ncbi:Late embryogenesis abundant hydroxyproline-rich glycoprotein family, putative [Theobroma cacao]|uniref:Late embryogenesis abundant hydroxyproline-rich glycoprotein family, putative n=1 Tax=Theobroma cacao TaxID=3641 RepID=A0A061DTS6_THECC|nr:Late embryogenesis abundant hydroxyproline-rich glycoprotein family, putative [Theobroma cacao]
MPEPPLKPVLQKPPGYKDPSAPAVKPGFRPPPRKPVLPPSFHPKKRRGGCCRVCCCCFCIFFLILILLLLICGAVFYLWFDPKLPGFHVQSVRISRFNVTNKPDGTYLDAQTTTRLEVKNPNAKMTYYYGNTEVDVSVGEGGDETELGTTTVHGFTMGKQNTTSLKVETKVINKLVDDGVGTRLQARYRSKSLRVSVEARTKIGLGVAGLKIGMVGVTVKCDGIALKRLDGGDMPKCVINMLKWAQHPLILFTCMKAPQRVESLIDETILQHFVSTLDCS